jgi:predicted nucleic acid-binding protein
MNPDIPKGERCFVDTNILLYVLTSNPPYTQITDQFFRRVALGEIEAFTSSIVLSEVLHKLMLAEVSATFPSATRPLRYLQKHPHVIGQLLTFPHAVGKLVKIGLKLLPVETKDWELAATLCVTYSLFTNDACIIALMQAHGIRRLVTNDQDFMDVPGITIHWPRA